MERRLSDHINQMIEQGRFFQFSASLLEVYEKKRWLCALVNNSDSRVMLHKLELYWDGGDVTPINKRECMIGFFSGENEISQDEEKPLYLPNPLSSDLDMVSFHVAKGFEGQFGLTQNHDPDIESFYPIMAGKTKMGSYIMIEPGEKLFIGTYSKVTSGNLSVIGKGWLYDQEEQPEIEPEFKITQ